MPLTTSKLYLIIVHFGLVGGTVGPLPYDMAECRSRAAEMADKIAAAWADPETAAKLRADDPRSAPDTMTFECRELSVRPENGSALKPEARP